MLTIVFLSTLLIMGGLGGKSILSGKTLSSDDGRYTMRKQPRQQIKREICTSLDLESFKLHVTPTSSKIKLPNIVKLYPPTAEPLYLHANMPLRFGRDRKPGDDRTQNTTPNMPQRFGRSWGVIQLCAKCPNIRDATEKLQRHGINSPFWSLIRTLANAQLLNTGLHWAKDFDLTTSSEVMEMQEKNYEDVSRHGGLLQHVMIKTLCFYCKESKSAFQE